MPDNDVLALLYNADEPATGIEISDVLGTPRSTTYKVLNTLRDSGLVERKYIIGFKLTVSGIEYFENILRPASYSVARFFTEQGAGL